MNNCYLNDLGLICSLGSNKRDILHNLLIGSTDGLIEQSHYLPDHSCIVGAVPGPLPAIPQALSEYDCRNNQLVLAALEQVSKAIESIKKQYGSDRIAVVMASSTSGVASTEEALRYHQSHQVYPDNYHFKQQQLGGLAEFVADYCQITGPAYTLSTACSSGANAIVSARRLLNLGVCDAVIVGGADSLCQLTVQGFSSLEAMSSSYCSPFAEQRDGINIGEAAAMFILSKKKTGAALLGAGSNSDAHHISAPDPSGQGAIQSMETALSEAGVSANQIDYLNLHGTATRQNDAMESKAVYHVFSNKVACSSTKAQTGHVLGTAAILELGFCWLLLQKKNQMLPSQQGSGLPDKTLPAINIIRSSSTHSPIRYCMSNAFAFGGSNTSILIGTSS